MYWSIQKLEHMEKLEIELGTLKNQILLVPEKEDAIANMALPGDFMHENSNNRKKERKGLIKGSYGKKCNSLS